MSKVKYYMSANELALKTRCHFGQLTLDGWRARRTGKGATHQLFYIVVYGRLDRDVACFPIVSIDKKEVEK